jgi:hypothetical protein
MLLQLQCEKTNAGEEGVREWGVERMRNAGLKKGGEAEFKEGELHETQGCLR